MGVIAHCHSLPLLFAVVLEHAAIKKITTREVSIHQPDEIKLATWKARKNAARVLPLTAQSLRLNIFCLRSNVPPLLSLVTRHCFPIQRLGPSLAFQLSLVS